MPIAWSELTALVVANEPDEGAKKDSQYEAAPETTTMKAEPTTTVMFLTDLLFCFQAVSFFGEDAVLLGLSQFHGFPLNWFILIGHPTAPNSVNLHPHKEKTVIKAFLGGDALHNISFIAIREGWFLSSFHLLGLSRIYSLTFLNSSSFRIICS
jgi:hypothetical protein